MDAPEIIERLGLRPHPEGGGYAATWRAPARDGERPAMTAIHFLLAAGERSHWHRVDASEAWLFHGGDPLELRTAEGDAGPVTITRLGMDLGAGETPQAVVPAGWWQAALSLGAWTLVSCTVAPGFDFAGFELAPPDWEPGAG
jgi:predicted cupin superfamily sugar epimerase